MPNGGSDCCGECGHFRPSREGGGWCQIRDLFVVDPFWTYCGNQTHQNPDAFDIPIGPVKVNDPREAHYERVIWRANVDSIETRDSMLAFLDSAVSGGSIDWMGGGNPRFVEVVQTLIEWRDERVLVRLVSMLQPDGGQGVLPPDVASDFIEEIGPFSSLDTLRDARAALGTSHGLDQRRIAGYLDLMISHTEAHSEAFALRRTLGEDPR